MSNEGEVLKHGQGLALEETSQKEETEIRESKRLYHSIFILLFLVHDDKSLLQLGSRQMYPANSDLI